MRVWRTLARAASLLLILGASAPAGGDAAADRAFLDQYWRRPIASQGVPPAHFFGLERSLAPSDCGTCHPAQFADWTTSVHARSMGPGVTGQLVGMWRSDPESARLCLSCHAPLAEQDRKRGRGDRAEQNADVDPELQHQGLVCAACHVRGFERFGPPRRNGSIQLLAPRAYLAHHGVTRTTAFEQSAFCVSCHQFPTDGFELNGKLLENTYEEWKRSLAARVRGQRCQSCHMPDRRHLWRGIHDPGMVRSGVQISVTTERWRYRPNDELKAMITVTNVGVGHYFPTYVTPRVVVRAGLVDASGASVPGSAQEYVIARQVALDLSREISDTRIPPDARANFSYRRRLETAGLMLRVIVTVYPDHFYTELFESLLASGAGVDTTQIRQALEASRRSVFDIFSKDVPLT